MHGWFGSPRQTFQNMADRSENKTCECFGLWPLCSSGPLKLLLNHHRKAHTEILMVLQTLSNHRSSNIYIKLHPSQQVPLKIKLIIQINPFEINDCFPLVGVGIPTYLMVTGKTMAINVQIPRPHPPIACPSLLAVVELVHVPGPGDHMGIIVIEYDLMRSLWGLNGDWIGIEWELVFAVFSPGYGDIELWVRVKT